MLADAQLLGGEKTETEKRLASTLKGGKSKADEQLSKLLWNRIWKRIILIII